MSGLVVTVNQADRDAAALALGYRNWEDANDYRLSGEQDRRRDHIVQALARHRTQAEAASKAREDALVEALADAAWGLETAKNALAWAGRRMACQDYAKVIDNDARNAGIVLERARAILAKPTPDEGEVA